MPNFARLNAVYEKARQAQVDFKMEYIEGSNEFCFGITSGASNENWYGNDHSFDIAVDTVLERLDELLLDFGSEK